MNTRVAEILSDMKGRHNAKDISFHVVHTAELLSILAEEQAQAADKLERHTRRLVWLTWALLILTAVLCLREVVVSKNADAQQDDHGIAHQFNTQKP